jgi:hypothetical protein
MAGPQVSVFDAPFYRPGGHAGAQQLPPRDVAVLPRRESLDHQRRRPVLTTH